MDQSLPVGRILPYIEFQGSLSDNVISSVAGYPGEPFINVNIQTVDLPVNVNGIRTRIKRQAEFVFAFA